jgi:SPP1 gp7 family putative phage head morphogenesis protein
VGAADAALADLLITHGINLLRLSAGYQRDVLVLLRALEVDLIRKLVGGPVLTEIGRQRLLDILAETRSAIAQSYVLARRAVDLDAIATTEVAHTQRAFEVGVQLTVGLPSQATMKVLVSGLLIHGAPSAEWWSRQGQDTAFRFSGAVRLGVAQGETNAQIVQRIRGTRTQPGVMEVSRRNAEALVRSSVQTAANAARLQTFRENENVIDGLMQLSTLDGRTSDVCVAYSGAEWDLAGKPINGTTLPFNGGPPRHWNCRSVLTPIVNLGIDFKPTRASAGGPVRGDMTFADWLAGKSKTFQDDLLGPGKAELFRDGKITLQQLLDQRGRPLTLEQLREKYQ